MAGARLVWVGVMAPPLAWAAQLVIGYSFQEAGCGRPDASLWGASLTWLTATVVVVGGVIAGAGGLASLAAWRVADDPRGRIRFMAIAGVASAFIFLFAIVLTGIALFPLDPCAAG